MAFDNVLDIVSGRHLIEGEVGFRKANDVRVKRLNGIECGVK